MTEARKGVDVTRRDLCKEHKETPTPAKVLLSFTFFCCFFFFSAFLKKTKQNTKQIKKNTTLQKITVALLIATSQKIIEVAYSQE